MHTGLRYSNVELILWTRRSLLRLVLVSSVPVILYQAAGLRWLAIPWPVVALLGTATAFIVGFKNTQTYNRTWEARQIWGGIVNSSRAFAMLCRDSIEDRGVVRTLFVRHFAWLTALRYAMRERRAWEAQAKAHNEEYQSRTYLVPEQQQSLEEALAPYLDADVIVGLLRKQNRAAQILALQSETLASLHRSSGIDSVVYAEFQRALRDLVDQQGRSERIKNFPYPRQFATINSLFIQIFCVLLPFGMLREFERLGEPLGKPYAHWFVWLVVPFCVLVCWMYTTLDQVGESTENPFEGSPNDVPISQMSRAIEIAEKILHKELANKADQDAYAKSLADNIKLN